MERWSNFNTEDKQTDKFRATAVQITSLTGTKNNTKQQKQRM